MLHSFKAFQGYVRCAWCGACVLHAGADDLAVLQTSVYEEIVNSAARKQEDRSRPNSPSQYELAASSFTQHVLPHHTDMQISLEALVALLSRCRALVHEPGACAADSEDSACHACARGQSAGLERDKVVSCLLNIGCLSRNPSHLDG